MSDIIGIVWLIGWVLSYHYILRVLSSMSNGRTDSEDYIFAGLFALMIGWTWPVVMAGRLAYIGWMRYVPPFSIPALAIKPIKPPTTYRERKALKAAENEEEQELFQKWVRERELA